MFARSAVGLSILVTLAGAKPIQIARDLTVKNEVQIGGAVRANELQVNGTLTGASIEVSATLEATTIRSDTVYTDVLSAKSGDTILVEGNLELIGTSAKRTAVAAGGGRDEGAPVSFLATSVVIDGVKQWSLASSENFDDQNIGQWINTDNALKTTACGHPDDFFLGGACALSTGVVSKTFQHLPDHSEVRIKATMNFIDQWRGEQAWCKINDNYVWLDTVGHPSAAAKMISTPSLAAARVTRDTEEKEEKTSHVMSVCGSDKYSDISLGTLVDVTKRHEGETLKIEFGTSLEGVVDSCTQSWGVDDVQIYIR